MVDGQNAIRSGEMWREKGMHSCCVIPGPSSPRRGQVLNGGDTLGKGRGFGSRDVFESDRERNLFLWCAGIALTEGRRDVSEATYLDFLFDFKYVIVFSIYPMHS